MINFVENYIFLFGDVLFSNIAFCFKSGFVLDIMLMSGFYDASIIYIIALIAYMISISINFIFGRVLFNIYNSCIDNEEGLKNYDSLKHIFDKNLFLLILIFSFFTQWIIILCGFLQIKFRKVLVVALLVYIIYIPIKILYI
jgi:membrane protein YqaA with SNARE-associated domain